MLEIGGDATSFHAGMTTTFIFFGHGFGPHEHEDLGLEETFHFGH